MTSRFKVVMATLAVGLLLAGSSEHRSTASGSQPRLSQALADVVVADPVTLSPPSVEQGEQVNIIAEVSNRGSAPISQSIEIVFGLEDIISGSFKELGIDDVQCLTFPKQDNASRCLISGLAAPGQPCSQIEIRAQLSTINLQPGSDYIVIVRAEISDANPPNNSGGGRLSVLAPVPNLLILDAAATAERPVKRGERALFEFTLENDRRVEIHVPQTISLSFRKRGAVSFKPLLFPAVSCSSCAPDSIQPFEQKAISLEILTDFLEPGEYQLQIRADSDDIVEESDETDNSATITFVVEGGQ